MPRSRRRSRGRTSVITSGHIMALKHGQDFFHELPGEDLDFANNPEKQRKLWKEIGPSIMQEWMVKRDRAGSRPYAWWQFDCPGEVLEGESEPQALLRLGKLEQWEVDQLNSWSRSSGNDWTTDKVSITATAKFKSIPRNIRGEYANPQNYQ